MGDKPILDDVKDNKRVVEEQERTIIRCQNSVSSLCNFVRRILVHMIKMVFSITS